MTEVLTQTADVANQMDLSVADSKGALAVRAENNTAADKAKVKKLIGELDIKSSTSIISFGVEAQGGLSERSDAILSGVRNKDTGPAGEIMVGMMSEIRGLGIDDLNPGEKQGFFSKLMGKATPLVNFLQSFETVESQVDAMINKLEGEKRKLERDVLMLDGMYDDALVFFNELAYYIEAGDIVLVGVRETNIPALQKAVDDAVDDDAMMRAQELRDMTERANDLERKIYDLKLTKTVTMQLLPQLRMIQDVDKGLITKTQSLITTTVPAWKTQIAMAITLHRQASATATIKVVTDGANEIMAKTSELLKTGSAAARKEQERGIFDIETVKLVNANLIATIIEATEIAEEGQKARIAGAADMLQCEADLKDALRNTKSAATDALEG